MARLRGPDGCPWDREQTLATLRPYVLEETYEVLEAIDGGDPRPTGRSSGTSSSRSSSRHASPRRRGASTSPASPTPSRTSSSPATRTSSDRTPGAPTRGPTPTPPESATRTACSASGPPSRRRRTRPRGAGKSVLEGVPRELPALATGRAADREGEPGRLRLARRGRRPRQGGRGDWGSSTRPSRPATGRRSRTSWGTSSSRWPTSPGSWESRRRRRFGERSAGSSPASSYVEAALERQGVPHGAATLEEMDRLWEEAKALFGQSPRTS